jgi:hypothetical protein
VRFRACLQVLTSLEKPHYGQGTFKRSVLQSHAHHAHRSDSSAGLHELDSDLHGLSVACDALSAGMIAHTSLAAHTATLRLCGFRNKDVPPEVLDACRPGLGVLAVRLPGKKGASSGKSLIVTVNFTWAV